jgi:hypothetical protein
MTKRSRSLLFTGLAVTAILTVPRAQAQLPPPYKLTPRFSYAAKFVCGLSPASTNLKPPQEPEVKPGNYATIINIHNPWPTDVALLKKVVLAAPERFPNTQIAQPSKRFPDRLPSDHALSVDCSEIVNLLTLSPVPIPGPFIEGFVVIDSFFAAPPAGTDPSADVDVVAVTTTAASATGTVNSHDVTTVPGRKLPAGTWPF